MLAHKLIPFSSLQFRLLFWFEEVQYIRYRANSVFYGQQMTMAKPGNTIWQCMLTFLLITLDVGRASADITARSNDTVVRYRVRSQLRSDVDFLTNAGPAFRTVGGSVVGKLYANDGLGNSQFGIQMAANDAARLVFVATKQSKSLPGKVYVFQQVTDEADARNNNGNDDDDDDDDADGSYSTLEFGNYSDTFALQGAVFSCAADGFGASIASPPFIIPPMPNFSSYEESLVRPPMLYVGAPDSDKRGPNTGEAFIFTVPELPLQQPQPCPVVSAVPSDKTAHPNSKFSISLAAFGSKLLVGAPNHWDAPLLSDNKISGAAYIFECFGPKCTQSFKLLPYRGGTDAAFGCAVGIFQDVLVVAACGDNSVVGSGGSVYIYDNENSIPLLVTSLVPPDLQDGAHFGHCLAVTNKRIVVAAYEEDSSASWIAQRKVIYLYGRTDTTVLAAGGSDATESNRWNLIVKIRSPSGDYLDMFGTSLLIYRDQLVIIGAPGALNGKGVIHAYGSYDRAQVGCGLEGEMTDGVETVDPGILYRNFTKTELCVGEGWRHLVNLSSADSEDYAQYGASLVALNDTLLVAASAGTGLVAFSGVVYAEWHLLTAFEVYFGASNGEVEISVPDDVVVEMMSLITIMAVAFGSAAAVAVLLYVSTLRLGCYNDNYCKSRSDPMLGTMENSKIAVADPARNKNEAQSVEPCVVPGKVYGYTLDSDDDDDSDGDEGNEGNESFYYAGDYDSATHTSKNYSSLSTRMSSPSVRSSPYGNDLDNEADMEKCSQPVKTCAVRTGLESPSRQRFSRKLMAKFGNKRSRHMAVRTEDSYDVEEDADLESWSNNQGLSPGRSCRSISTVSTPSQALCQTVASHNLTPSGPEPSLVQTTVQGLASLLGIWKGSQPHHSSSKAELRKPASYDGTSAAVTALETMNPLNPAGIPEAIMFQSKFHYRSNTCPTRFVSDGTLLNKGLSTIPRESVTSSPRIQQRGLSPSTGVSVPVVPVDVLAAVNVLGRPVDVRELLIARPARSVTAVTRGRLASPTDSTNSINSSHSNRSTAAGTCTAVVDSGPAHVYVDPPKVTTESVSI
jgi:hypothetical protein